MGLRDMHEEIIATIPQKQPDTVLEVALIHNDDGASHIELRCMTWGEGLGWYRQKTLALDRDAARALLQDLGQMRSQVSAAGPLHGGRKVIPLTQGKARQKTVEAPARHSQRA
jgi:hypothetical protein